jgi:hypothetical protein
MKTFFHYRFESGTQGKGRLSSSGSATQRDDSDIFIKQDIQSDSLFGASTVQTKSLAITANQFQLLAFGDSS